MNEEDTAYEKSCCSAFLSLILYCSFCTGIYMCVKAKSALLCLYTAPVVALYFVIAGNIFAHQLGLNRWLLWLSLIHI